jgi:hypothetical protein
VVLVADPLEVLPAVAVSEKALVVVVSVEAVLVEAGNILPCRFQ